jgi:hypothetical protein
MTATELETEHNKSRMDCDGCEQVNFFSTTLEECHEWNCWNCGGYLVNVVGEKAAKEARKKWREKEEAEAAKRMSSKSKETVMLDNRDSKQRELIKEIKELEIMFAKEMVKSEPDERMVEAYPLVVRMHVLATGKEPGDPHKRWTRKNDS